MKKKVLYILDQYGIIVILCLGALFRFFGLNWDQGFHLHPDERAIVLFTLPLHFFSTFIFFFSPNSQWNPHFFAYGSFPLYLLKILSSTIGNINTEINTYTSINLLGRVISTCADIGTMLTIFFMGKKLWNKHIGMLAGFFYAISVLPIQLSHFYAVDTLLTLFIVQTLYTSILFYEHPTVKKALRIGIFLGLAFATKISASVLLIAIGSMLTVDFFLLFIKHVHKPVVLLSYTPTFLKRLLIDGLLILSMALLVFIITEPYAFIDYEE